MKRFLLTAAAGLALTCAVTQAAFAEGEGSGPPFPENGTIYITSIGNVFHKTLSAAEMSKLMQQGATELKAGAILTMHDGKIYIVQDHKMNDGKMLAEEIMLRASAGFR